MRPDRVGEGRGGVGCHLCIMWRVSLHCMSHSQSPLRQTSSSAQTALPRDASLLHVVQSPLHQTSSSAQTALPRDASCEDIGDGEMANIKSLSFLDG